MSTTIPFDHYTFDQFKNDFSSEEDCLKYLFTTKYEHRDDLDQFVLLKDTKKYINLGTGEVIDPIFSTLFEDSKVPLLVWFEAIYWFMQDYELDWKFLKYRFNLSTYSAKSVDKKVRRLLEGSN